MQRGWFILSVIFCAAGSAAGAGNLAHNGDFELPSPKGPPPGWAMWGPSKYKAPANFTRDTSGPHGGRACFRIHHPANTAGVTLSQRDLDAHPLVKRTEDAIGPVRPVEYVPRGGQAR